MDAVLKEIVDLCANYAMYKSEKIIDDSGPVLFGNPSFNDLFELIVQHTFYVVFW